MPNHYCHVITAYPRVPEEEEDYEAAIGRLKAWAVNPCARLRPVPEGLAHPNPEYLSDAEYLWRREHWGTKWDTYADRVERLPGDGGPVVVTFNTAWSAPSADLIALMLAELKPLVNSAVWIGMNPYDNSTVLLGEVAR